jgi:hypothetical protein
MLGLGNTLGMRFIDLGGNVKARTVLQRHEITAKHF